MKLRTAAFVEIVHFEDVNLTSAGASLEYLLAEQVAHLLKELPPGRVEEINAGISFADPAEAHDWLQRVSGNASGHSVPGGGRKVTSSKPA